jgi:membrane-bound ClpP family serine protease
MEPWVWAWLLLIVGLVIIGIEMFIPSGGFLGVLSALAILGAIVLAFVSSLKFGVFMMVLVSCLLPALFAIAVKYWPNTPIGRLIVARPPSSDEVLPHAETRRTLQSLIGRRGVASCQMLPGGVVVVDGVSYDAVTDGTPIDKGMPIQVTAIRMNRLEVRFDDRPESMHSPLAAEPPSQLAPSQLAQTDELLSRPIQSLGIEPLDDPLK